MKQKLLIILGMLIAAQHLSAQNVGIGTTTPDPSAAVDITSTNKGMLVPRMTATERGLIAGPATGLIVFQTTAPAGFYYNAGTPGVPNWVLLINNTNTVTTVSASSPLSSSGGTTPNIELNGTSGGILYGSGTGSAFSAAGSPGQFLKSNGASAPSWSNLGQTGSSVFGTTAITVSNATTSFVIVPGLSQTITVPSNSFVFISTDGGVITTSTAATGFSIVDIALFIDGTISANGGFRRLTASNTTGLTGDIENWSFAIKTELTAGSHTIQVGASVGGGAAITGNSPATVSGDGNSILQGTLNILILNK